MRLSRHGILASVPWNLALFAGALVLSNVGCRLIADFPDPPISAAEFRCRATVLNDAGWVEALASGDPELCSGPDGCWRILNDCEYGGESSDTPAIRLAEWQRQVAEALGSGTFRGHPGPWCLAEASCELLAEFDRSVGEPPACRPSTATALPACGVTPGCLALSQGALAFGEQATGAASAARFVEVSNTCAEAIGVVLDRRVTCAETALCTACTDPGDLTCRPDFALASDCLPPAGFDVRRLEGTTSLDPSERRCQLSLAFEPQRRGPRAAEVFVTTDGGESLRLRLNGVGVGGDLELSGPAELCRDPSFLIDDPPCTRPGDNLHLALTNTSSAGLGRIESVQLPEGTGFFVVQTYRTQAGSAAELPTEAPTALAPGDTFHVIARWCRNRSPDAGAVDEAVSLIVTTDDPVSGPAHTVSLRWRAGGCS